jgi:hypothetical protein
MKFLVLASDAQLGVISGSKKAGAICNGMQALTLPSRRLSFLEKEEAEKPAGGRTWARLKVE